MTHTINFGTGFQRWSGWEYLCIDLANHYGLDKELFEDRIQWVYDNFDDLEALAVNAETPELYRKTVMTIRRAQLGEEIGHIVHFDACCSGIQIMSALTGCYAGAYNTGMIDPRQRMDAYGNTTAQMNVIFAGQGMASISVPRKDVKQAMMTSGYGSKAVPKRVFGEGEKLEVFYEAAHVIAPGAFTLMDELLESWRPFALDHSYIMPDGFNAVIRVMQTKETRIEVDELGGATFTLQYKENEGSERGLSNVANTIHGCDAYLLRGLERRCNYDKRMVEQAREILMSRMACPALPVTDEKLAYYLPFWNQSKMADVVILPFLTFQNIDQVPHALVTKLLSIVNDMLTYEPFPVITVHDSFGCHANNCDITRYWYKEILADMADSTMLEWLMNQLYQTSGITYTKLSNDLGDKIRNSNYALS